MIRTESGRADGTTSLTAKPTAELEQLKQQLLEQQLACVAGEPEKRWLRHAVEEAASVAWSTAYPLLVFPGLLEEKADQARDRFNRQSEITRRNPSMPAQAE
ncbi:MAG TPA: hypothetical protein VJW76_07670 [Verrucomicrobiae bacterium]|nr:hypothetical protein [Verrucomicrobiae bacterium]